MTIRLSTFGRVRCELDDCEIDDLPAQRLRCSMLLYLAVERDVARDALAHVFWPDRDEEKSRHTLNQTLYELRRLLGDDWLDSYADRLRVTDAVSTDLTAFERAAQAKDWPTALALYQGAFLQDFSVPQGKPLEFWTDRHRAHSARLHRVARRASIVDLLSAHDHIGALVVARRWVELEPFEDEAQHRLIELLAANSERAEALQQCERYERLLTAEGLQPLDETKQLLERIRSGEAVTLNGSTSLTAVRGAERGSAGALSTASNGATHAPAGIQVVTGDATGTRGKNLLPDKARLLVKRAFAWSPLAVAALLLTIQNNRSQPGSDQPTLFEVTFSDGVRPTDEAGVNFALSRDGSQLAFTGTGPAGRAIYLRQMDALDARAVPGTEGGTSPQFSPNGKWLMFFAKGQLKKVQTAGGVPVRIAVPESGEAGRALRDASLDGWGSTWGDGNEIIVSDGTRLWHRSADEGEPEVLARLDTARMHRRYGWPHMLPGGNAALITIWKRSLSVDIPMLGVVSVPDGKVTELGIQGSNPRYLSSKHILFGRPDGSVVVAPFSLRRLQVTGPASPVLEKVAVSSSGGVQIASADNGTIVYKTVAETPFRRLVRVDRNGVVQPIDFDSVPVSFPRIDPGGRRVAITIQVDSANDIWNYDLISRTRTRVTFDSVSARAEWTPDGQRIAYISFTKPKGSVRSQPWNSSGKSDVLIDTTVAEISFGPPHGYLAVRFSGGIGTVGSNIAIAPMDSPQVLRPYLSAPATEKNPRVSPNGRLLAYVTDENGSDEVYVQALPPGGGSRIQISHAGGQEPVWGPNSNELYYRSGDWLLVSALVSETPVLDIVRKDSLFPDTFMRSNVRANFDVLPNGQGFIFVENAGGGERRMWGYARWSQGLKLRTQSLLVR